jgi:hypothetical protein
LAPLLIAGCGDYGSFKIDGPYILLWIDDPEEVRLSYEVSDSGSVERVPAKVVSYGVSDEYVTAYREGVGYYYIDRSKDGPYADVNDAVFGPFYEAQFMQLQTELTLPPLKPSPKRF